MPGKPKKKTTARQSATNLIIQKIDQLRSDMEAGFKQTSDQLRGEMQTGNDQLRSEMQSGIDQLRGEMQSGFKQADAANAQLRSEMQTGNDQLRAEMQSGIGQLRGEMQTGFKEVNARIDNVEAKLTSLDEYTRSNIRTFGKMINEITGEISKMIGNAGKRAQNALKEVQAETNSKVLAQDEKIGRLESTVDLVNIGLTQLRQDHEQLEQRVKSLEAIRN